ncbi:glutathione S-transferase family protein [Aggregicoccus sp. 17bor-14]|uniref:glutathione S-transferase N-terminal domain-containing protein n=1 Tax=Myxococcaceae TaxID=31 RepID=UPI00129CA9DA|nr:MULTISPECIES: glutathione S-transferase N-terminal domain-containing protein [Myxococcaceae]MBF5043018.1 glutathione S-transferase N-terminal domain-containing protein [Simulacricoccus sp. 17bor-14]MRI88782.1 glutathione S-transferase family protein [Aggregicoccus sp. 17bor-14]
MPDAAIDLYTFTTPNGRKASIALEEVGLPYRVHVVDITKGQQLTPEYLAINPNNKIPAIVDHAPADGGAPFTLFESGAILLYLAEKTGKLLPRDTRGRAEVTQWVMWQMGGLGPMFGQMNHFRRYAKEQNPYAIQRYTEESQRLMGVLEKALSTGDHVATCGYSMADVAAYPWVHAMVTQYPELLEGREHARKWLERVGARPAVQRGMDVPKRG